MQVIASRRPASSDDLLKARKDLATASAKVVIDQSAVAIAQAQLAKDKANGAPATQLTTDQMAIATLQASVLSEQKDMAAAQATIDVIEKAQGRWVETASITLLSPAPDAKFRYIANLRHNGLRDDNLTIGVNTSGLLSTSQVTSQDQTPNILGQIAGSIAALSTGIGGGIFNAYQINGLLPQQSNVMPECHPYEVNRIFDPLDADAVKQVADELSEHGANLQFAIDAQKVDKVITPPDEVNGLFYRTLVPIVVRLTPKGGSEQNTGCPLQNNPQAQAALSLVPDTSTAAILSAEAGAFTTTNLNYTFTNGVLTQANFVRPSEVKGFGSIFVDVPQKIISIPTDLIKLRVDYDTQTASVINQKVTELQNQLSLLNAQKAIDDARRQASGGAAGAANAGSSGQ